ncbi:hypothetical protein PIB30_063275 [Stylosanthes scabra]|uniref:Reverse transcriptase zinc-binding domain-containing protein n=1 Tax=Stylosanthes scabra TaxID=79078 RepID=A0ABU6UNK8_9FABA|nr:hypothetical protein [Stylosanthes scabra]
MAATGRQWGDPTFKHVFDNIWHCLVPPRVEMLVWFVLMGGLNTRDVLLRRSIIRQGDEVCVLCNGAAESDVVRGKIAYWFLRNKTASKKPIFNGVEVIFKQENEFRARAQWIEKAKSTNERWIHWG